MSFKTADNKQSTSHQIDTQFTEELVEFRLSSLEPNLKSFGGRVNHFMNTTNPLNLLASDAEILRNY